MDASIRLAVGDPSAELGATYDELGGLLAAWDNGTLSMLDEEFEETCADLVDRLIVLGKLFDQYSALRWALALSRIRSEGEN